MSIEIHVLLKNSNIPSVAQWQQAIHAAGFDLMLDHTFSVREHSGFLLATYKGIETGFEFDLSNNSDIISTYSDVVAHIENRDLSANFRWGGRLTECVAALIASAILAKLSDGIVYDPQSETFETGDEALRSVRQLIPNLVVDRS
jgi:hypothetical protein